MHNEQGHKVSLFKFVQHLDAINVNESSEGVTRRIGFHVSLLRFLFCFVLILVIDVEEERIYRRELRRKRTSISKEEVSFLMECRKVSHPSNLKVSSLEKVYGSTRERAGWWLVGLHCFGSFTSKQRIKGYFESDASIHLIPRFMVTLFCSTRISIREEQDCKNSTNLCETSGGGNKFKLIYLN